MSVHLFGQLVRDGKEDAEHNAGECDNGARLGRGMTDRGVLDELIKYPQGVGVFQMMFALL